MTTTFACGHPFTPQNTYRKGNVRQQNSCWTCLRIRHPSTRIRPVDPTGAPPPVRKCGHPLSDDNTYRSPSEKGRCLTCYRKRRPSAGMPPVDQEEPPRKPPSSLRLRGPWTVLPLIGGRHSWTCHLCDDGYGSQKTKADATAAAIKHQRSKHA